jgi:hypothetical protein
MSVAASNNRLDKLDYLITFPARLVGLVFCIFFTDRVGRRSTYNPPGILSKDSFAILGERVQIPFSPSRGHRSLP